MKTLLCLTLIAGALAAPTLSFAQATTSELTRAQVRAELVSLEKLGYHVWDFSDTTYPEAIQAAEAKLAAQQGSERLTVESKGGVPQAGASQAGAPSHELVSSDRYTHP
ncbi:MAG TPA: DUF4148 domain-containing protein [Trinickia sp.]|jgi:hypothetical protein|nr:DUF4148 domain-containing protein [Trinickia sp.]